MFSAILVIFYSVSLLVCGFFYLKKRGYKEFDGKLKDVLETNWKFLCLTLIAFAVLSAAVIFNGINSGWETFPLMLRWTTLYCGMFLLAKIDYKERLIPNVIILVLLGLRLGFLVYEFFTNIELWKMVIIYPVLGALIGAFVMIVAMLISRKGVGMGDIKMFFMIGAYVGSSKIFGALFLSFFVSAIAGILLLITRKAKLKDSIPMAPFAFVGVAMEYLLMIGG